MNKRLNTIFLIFTFLATPHLQAQEPRPLIWAADLDGGIPYVFKNDQGEIVGFEVDIVNALAKEMGRAIEFKQCDFKSLLSHIGRGDCDFAMNGIEITAENQQQVRFTRPYYLYQLQLVTRIDETRCRNLDDCKMQGLTVATLAASSAERYLDDRKIPKQSYDDQEGPFRDLQQKVVAGVLLDVPIALYYAVPDPRIQHARGIPGLKFAGATVGEGYYGIAVAEKNEPLAKQLDAALVRLQESGELKRILNRWELWNPDQYRLQSFDEVDTGEAKTLYFSLYFPMLLEGALWTIVITVGGMSLAIALGLPIALMRLYGPWPLRVLAVLYVEFFRGIPILILLYFIYFGLPVLIPGFKLYPIGAAILGFGLNYAAYESEIYRAGLGSIAPGQWEAAASLGMSPFLTFRRIILPQAWRMILPPMTNDFIALFKDTSIVSIISAVELSKQYQILTKTYGGFVEIGLATASLYLVMSVPLGYLSRYLEKRWGNDDD